MIERFDLEERKQKVVADRYKEMEEKHRKEFEETNKFVEKESIDRESQRKKLSESVDEHLKKQESTKELIEKELANNIVLPKGVCLKGTNLYSERHHKKIGKVESYKDGFIIVVFFNEAKRLKCLTRMNQLVVKGVKIAFV